MIEPPRLLDKTRLNFKNITNEEYRIYRFPGGEYVRVNGGLWLDDSEPEHKIIDSKDFCHIIASGWLRVKWKVKSAEYPHFVD